MQKKDPNNLVDLFIICHSYPLIPYVRHAGSRALQWEQPRASAQPRWPALCAYMDKLLALLRR